jgi:hypothetical protein
VLVSAIDEFLRRFAASPMHVAQLERVLEAYGGTSPEALAEAFLGWDREAAHPEATRIALELLANGLIEETPLPVVDIARLRSAILSVPAGGVSVRVLLCEHLAAGLSEEMPAPDLARGT